MSTHIGPTTRGNTVWADAVAQRNGFSRVSDVEGDVRPSGTIGAGLKSAGPRLAIRSPRWRGRASSLSDRCRGFGRRGRGEAERASASSRAISTDCEQMGCHTHECSHNDPGDAPPWSRPVGRGTRSTAPWGCRTRVKGPWSA